MASHPNHQNPNISSTSSTEVHDYPTLGRQSCYNKDRVDRHMEFQHGLSRTVTAPPRKPVAPLLVCSAYVGDYLPDTSIGLGRPQIHQEEELYEINQYNNNKEYDNKVDHLAREIAKLQNPAAAVADRLCHTIIQPPPSQVQPMNKIPKKSHKKGQPPVGVRESEAATVVGLSLLDNCLTYIVFFKMGSPDANMYNLFEATLILMQTPLAALILSFAVSGTLLIVLGIVSFFWKPRLFRSLTGIRILISAVPCAVISALLASLSEGGFRGGLALISLFCCVLTSISWSLFCSIRLHSRLRSPLIVLLDMQWILGALAILVMFILYFSGSLFFYSNNLCKQSFNSAMPVYIKSLDRWYCGKWHETAWLDRPSETAIRDVRCHSTFVGEFGASLHAHRVTCPGGCFFKQVWTIKPKPVWTIKGCDLYASDSHICASAVHAGMIPDTGGNVTVYGSTGRDYYESCLKNGVVETMSYNLSVACSN
eukprot:GHVQ01014481.1.p1 GENE.GHVQ01014481.1~~GHVQ01014481.1.p1  ORF type:complete len:481 (+),score=43.95 GHVQ01014481.1:531-1973(+)